MGVVGDTLPTPPPGSSTPGDLYVDLTSKTLWLGVDPTVDAAGAVLISDILSLQPAIATALAQANSYTASQIATRAPLSHTHTASQITDFAAAVAALGGGGGGGGSSFSAKMTILYAGALTDIGVGPLAGWALCDGNNGTPNLKDRFVIGAGNLPYGSVNPNATLNMSASGGHTHVVNGHVLTVAEMPNHGHNVSVSGGGTFGTNGSGDHVHAASADAQGAHSHVIGAKNNPTGGSNAVGLSSAGADHNIGTDVAGNHSHNIAIGAAGNHGHLVSVAFTSTGGTDAQGGNGSHDHTITTSGDHTHSITSANIRDAIPYFSMAFIMRLP